LVVWSVGKRKRIWNEEDGGGGGKIEGKMEGVGKAHSRRMGRGENHKILNKGHLWEMARKCGNVKAV
jgi:hypothetical protein